MVKTEEHSPYMNTRFRQILNKRITVDGVSIFYREAGDKNNPTLLLLHGFPTSSVMFKNLMIALSDSYHLVAPDYPGFGFSAFPDRKSFEYSFSNLAAYMNRFTEEVGLTSFTIYLHDYGCPVGLRLCILHPERIEGIIVQNGNAYDEGIGPQWNETKDYWQHPTEDKKKKIAAFLSAEGTKSQYTAGLPDKLLVNISPELWMLDWELMCRPGNIDMQFDLNTDYKTNIDMFPAFQEYFRKYTPPALIIWGSYDVFFDVKEAHCYKRDLPDATVHMVEGGHMALETNFAEVLELIHDFMKKIKR